MVLSIRGEFTKEIQDSTFLETGVRKTTFYCTIDTASQDPITRCYRKHLLNHTEFCTVNPADIGVVPFADPEPEWVYERWVAAKEEEERKAIQTLCDRLKQHDDLINLQGVRRPLTNMNHSVSLQEIIDCVHEHNKRVESQRLVAAQERRLQAELQQKAQEEAEAERRRKEKELAKTKPGLDFGEDRIGVTTLYVEQGATITPGPVYGEKDWIARISQDPLSPGGLHREFCKRAGGNFHHVVDTLQVGDAVEFGVNEYSRKGKKERRWYGIVTRTTDDTLDVLGPLKASVACSLDRELLNDVYVCAEAETRRDWGFCLRVSTSLSCAMTRDRIEAAVKAIPGLKIEELDSVLFAQTEPAYRQG